MICVHVLSAVLIQALSVALLMFVTPYFQIMTPAAHEHRTSGRARGHTQDRHAQKISVQVAHKSAYWPRRLYMKRVAPPS
jgi:hypothetical protein